MLLFDSITGANKTNDMPVISCYSLDKSKLFRAWGKYYDDMGLAYNKRNKKVYERVTKGKFPTK